MQRPNLPGTRLRGDLGRWMVAGVWEPDDGDGGGVGSRVSGLDLKSVQIHELYPAPVSRNLLTLRGVCVWIKDPACLPLKS